MPGTELIKEAIILLFYSGCIGGSIAILVYIFREPLFFLVKKRWENKQKKDPPDNNINSGG